MMKQFVYMKTISMTRLFNFLKNHLDIIRPLLFAVIGAACIYLFYRCTTEVKQRYFQEDKFDISENLRNNEF